ncbi:MAG TPA: pantetheine-phosphate adenylyltransferase [Clostridiales bacterium]|nr:pantetheine-phosphate adenylyltransferase [Clostridiales bacterium]
MRIGIYPGSFDPVTLGHVDIIKRASTLVDKLYVAVIKNKRKKSLFTTSERINMLRKVTKDIPNVEIEHFSGLTVDLAMQKEANVIFRGLRAVTDFEYELQLAQTNHKLNPDVDTVFLITNVEYAYLSSSIVREIASYNGAIESFVPESIIDEIYDKYKRGESEYGHK